MNAPETINAAPINLAHEVLLKADDALCVADVAEAILGGEKPKKAELRGAQKMLKQLADLGMIEMEPRAGGVPFYRLIVAPKPQVCDLVQTEGESQTALPAERVLTPEAEAEREQFISEFGYDGNCSCHISPPCNSCMHPGNPRNQEEDETAWMAAGDSEGGETDAPLNFATSPELQYLAPEDYEMPPTDLKLLAMANRAISEQLDEFRAQLSHIAAIAAAYLPDPSDISTARAVEIMDMLAEANLIYAERMEYGMDSATTFADSLRKTIANLRTAHNHALNEADRLRAELGAERLARTALQEQVDNPPAPVAQGYAVKAPKRPLRRFGKEAAAKSAAMAAARLAGRGEVFALVPLGVAVRGAEWKAA